MTPDRFGSIIRRLSVRRGAAFVHVYMEEFVKQSLLFDFYGDLLTEHQKDVYKAYVQENLSLGEIASELKISRQGVHDILKRCNLLLEGYEEKLGLVKRFLDIRQRISQIRACDSLETARSLAEEILDFL